MDYRYRDYFLIKTDIINYAYLHRKYKELCPSIKYHSARNFDFWWKPEIKDKYPWLPFHPQEMISVKKEESEKLLDFIADYKAYHGNLVGYGHIYIIQITKEHLGQ